MFGLVWRLQIQLRQNAKPGKCQAAGCLMLRLLRAYSRNLDYPWSLCGGAIKQLHPKEADSAETCLKMCNMRWHALRCLLSTAFLLIGLMLFCSKRKKPQCIYIFTKRSQHQCIYNSVFYISFFFLALLRFRLCYCLVERPARLG